eukprot:scaffold12091_cov69-Phaeocystis_antarctica.AAC.3
MSRERVTRHDSEVLVNAGSAPPSSAAASTALRSAPTSCQCLLHSVLCHVASRGTVQIDTPKGRQRDAVERGDEGGAAGVGDLGPFEAEPLELRQPSSRRRRRTCRRQRRHEGGEALVAERVATEIERFQRGQPPQGRREGH